MKNSIFKVNKAVLTATALCLAACAPAHADDEPKASGGFGGVGGGGGGFGVVKTTTGDKVVIESVEPSGKEDKEVAWLGLGVGEAPEVLSSQLGLNPGEGLAVTYVAAGSPAEKAEFHKNDVLAELDGQLLMAPIQFRKLVEMHAPGDTVNVTFYRAGKKQTLAVKVGKTHWSQISDSDGQPAPRARSSFQNNLVRLPSRGLDAQAFGVGQSGARTSADTARIDMEIQRSMDQARRAIEDAVRNADGDHKALDAAKRALEAVARGGVAVDRDATVILRNKHDTNRTIVHTDESGTYILEAGAKSHLIAHDKTGKLLFEGDVDTSSEQTKVPKEVWEKVAPMIEESAAPGGAKQKLEDKE
jgi:hypothetical protein